MSGATTRETLRRITGRRVNASLLAGWLLSIGQTSAVKEVLAVLDSQEALPMLWRASLSDDANERQQFIAAAEHCHAHNVRFLTRSMKFRCCSRWATALARYLLGCFWYSKRRYDEAVSCWRETLENLRLCARSSSAGRLLGINSRMQRRRWLICSAP